MAWMAQQDSHAVCLPVHVSLGGQAEALLDTRHNILPSLPPLPSSPGFGGRTSLALGNSYQASWSACTFRSAQSFELESRTLLCLKLGLAQGKAFTQLTSEASPPFPFRTCLLHGKVPKSPHCLKNDLLSSFENMMHSPSGSSFLDKARLLC